MDAHGLHIEIGPWSRGFSGAAGLWIVTYEIGHDLLNELREYRQNLYISTVHDEGLRSLP